MLSAFPLSSRRRTRTLDSPNLLPCGNKRDSAVAAGRGSPGELRLAQKAKHCGRKLTTPRGGEKLRMVFVVEAWVFHAALGFGVRSLGKQVARFRVRQFVAEQAPGRDALAPRCGVRGNAAWQPSGRHGHGQLRDGVPVFRLPLVRAHAFGQGECSFSK